MARESGWDAARVLAGTALGPRLAQLLLLAVPGPCPQPSRSQISSDPRLPKAKPSPRSLAPSLCVISLRPSVPSTHPFLSLPLLCIWWPSSPVHHHHHLLTPHSSHLVPLLFSTSFPRHPPPPPPPVPPTSPQRKHHSPPEEPGPTISCPAIPNTAAVHLGHCEQHPDENRPQHEEVRTLFPFIETCVAGLLRFTLAAIPLDPSRQNGLTVRNFCLDDARHHIPDPRKIFNSRTQLRHLLPLPLSHTRPYR